MSTFNETFWLYFRTALAGAVGLGIGGIIAARVTDSEAIAATMVTACGAAAAAAVYAGTRPKQEDDSAASRAVAIARRASSDVSDAVSRYTAER